MRLIITGCEYTGTTTIANAICRWGRQAMGGRVEPHDHFKIPHIACYQGGPEAEPLTAEEQQQILDLSPKLKEMLQRQDMVYHYPMPGRDLDSVLVGYHIEDAVYGPMYFSYGLEDEPQGGPRSRYARSIEATFMERAPDTALVLVKAAPEVIARRMKEGPHHNGIVKEPDIQEVLAAFEREYEISVIKNKLTLDTSESTVEESLKEFKVKFEAYITMEDRTRIVVQRAREGA